jgi:Sulfotransferase family/Aspartyl/Asparaginyl beta-hydroxylase
MRLPRPFFQLPVLFDAARLREEVQAIPAAAWVEHPNSIPGNSAVRLISADGAESDAVQGQMLPTRWLQSAPYIRQILGSFGVVWSRSRLMRLAPGAEVPEHADINHHWYTRVRLHIPLITRQEVRFFCGDEVVHMAAGQAWIFDNWRLHRVVNPTPDERIHLVADTTGTAAFWQFACGQGLPPEQWRRLVYQPGLEITPMTEAATTAPLMPAAEVQLLVNDLRTELTAATESTTARDNVARFSGLLEGFICDWRQLCARHGILGEGLQDFRNLAAAVRDAARRVGPDVVMRTNRISAVRVLEARVLQHLVAEHRSVSTQIAADAALRRPVFIIAAPRSGSTLLFETLACTPALNTLGGEAHWLIESDASLRPGAPGVDSNRLEAAQATPQLVASIRAAAAGGLQGPDGRAAAPDARLLEKTPKNSLRIPFLLRAFPDAQFIFLWREPRANISSIMEAWRAGQWITYPQLPGWEGPWSLLLPPAWQNLRGTPLAHVAAQQWQRTNDTVLQDLQQLPAQRWTSVAFHDFIASPAATIQRLCRFMDVPFDEALQARTAAPLPPSRYTHTPPAVDKWHSNAAAIEPELPQLEATLQRLQALR